MEKKIEKQVSVQAAMGMVAQGLSALFIEKAQDTKMVTLPLSEYESILHRASETYKDTKIKEMQSEIDKLNITILDWQTRYASLERHAMIMRDGNNYLELKLALKEREILRLRNKSKWWQIWKK